ncbi:DUF1680 family protein [Mucilaginibacter gracilis]|uniref:DUF1680 family protein n=1 Tax=Mucilaginibacter gracilis TaxID=423350 RepID=A0A495ITE8_9SPHI|nr:beta-L-arabinofuranosidase domain-containing protein [Mucilaginibacter gracilis]RKR79940.1 DUF1680 family protein [Mucilaginibacter gracilis]
MKKLFLLITIFAMACLGIFAVKPPLTRVEPTDELVPRFDKFRESPMTANSAKGWLLEYLNRQRSGLTGHPDVLSYPFNTCLWAGSIERIGEKHGDNWWRYEQTAYYTDGLLRLGFELNDAELIAKGRAGINYTLEHVQPNGRLGPGLFVSQWPIAVFFRAMEAEYMATGDPKIIAALHKHYLSYTPEELGKFKRAIVNIEGALWTYGKTGDQKLLDLSEKAYALGGFELNLKNSLSPDSVVLHGVTYMEMAKLPAILYAFTGKKEYLDAAVNVMRKLDRDHMLPDGVPSSSEFLAGKNPLHSHETCDITDYTWAVGYLLMATGDATWADHIEKAVFNAGPGCVSKDFKQLQYFSSVNQFIATGNSNQNKFMHGSTWMAYWPCHETECCAGNVHRMMPNYVARMWMRDAKGNPIAALYGPSEEKVVLNSGQQVIIKEATSYPFSDLIGFTFETEKPVDMPFMFRIPGWCSSPSVTINGKPYVAALKSGTFVTINRKFTKGDKITLQLPMDAKLVNAGQGVTVERGPLLYAFAIPEKVKTDTATYANLGGKHSPDPNFPALDIRPAGNWNYALAVNEASFSQKIEVIKTGSTGYPLDPGKSPVIIKVPARKVKQWTLLENRFTPELPAPGQFDTEKTIHRITLVPYGSTRLRITEFPTTIN